MRARDLMTSDLVTVASSTPVSAVARLLVERRISAVPVVDGDQLVGLVSEGDLLHRHEAGTETKPSLWSELFRSSEDRARAYIKARGQTAAAVMTRDLKTVAPDTEVDAMAELMDRHKVKRLPVIADGRLLGIVSRADLLRLLLEGNGDRAQGAAVADRDVAKAVLDEIHKAGLATTTTLNVIATEGSIALYGFVASETERQAVEVAAIAIAGVERVENHLAVRPAYLTGA